MEGKIFSLLNSTQFNNLQEYYEKPTIFDILGVSRKELPHSNFIAWLLSPKESHGLRDFAIRKLLEIKYKALPSAIKDCVLTGDYEILKANVSREVPLGNAVAKGFLDIFIELKLELGDQVKDFYIIIENKIESEEGQDQTSRYQQWFEYTYKEADVLMLYLSSKENTNLSGDRFVNITYTELSNQLLSYCEVKASDEATKKLIQDYICCLSQPLIEGDDDKKHEVLAINGKEVQLVKELLQDHKETLLYIIDELVTMKNAQVSRIYKSNISTFKGIFNVMLLLDETVDYADKVNTLLENKVRKFAYNGRIYIKSGKKHNSFGYLVRAMINNYTMEVDTTYEELKALLTSKQWLSPWIDEIVTNTVPEDIDHFFMSEDEILRLGKERIYVARYWTCDDVIGMSELLKQELEVR